MTLADQLADEMRAAAATIRKCNQLYGFHPEYGMWNPTRLSLEADVVATGDDAEIERANRGG